MNRFQRFVEVSIENLRFGARSLARDIVFTLGVVGMLGLGIAATGFMYGVIDRALLNPRIYPELDRLVAVAEIGTEGAPQGPLVADLMALRETSQTLQSVTWHRLLPVTVTDSGGSRNVIGSYISADAFALLGVAATAGHPFGAADFSPNGSPVAMISQSLAHQLFNQDADAVGRDLNLNGRSCLVVGVMPAEFNYPRPDIQVWLPWRITPAEATASGARSHGALARLKKGATITQAQAEATFHYREGKAASGDEKRLDLTLYREFLTGRLAPVLWALFAAVGLVFAIACFNLTMLALARASRRAWEIAMRYTLGASRPQIAGQLLVESFLCSLLGGCLGILLIALTSKLLTALTEGWSPLPEVSTLGIDAKILGFTLLLSVAASALFGLTPAIRVSKPNLGVLLNSPVRGSGTGFITKRFRQLVVAGQIALSLVLLVGAVQMIRSVSRLQRVEPGFDAAQLLTVEVPAIVHRSPQDQKAVYERLLLAVGAVPGVQTQALTTVLPLGSLDIEAPVTFERPPSGAPQTGEVNIPLRAVSPDYFKTMGIPLIAGRFFSGSDDNSAPGVAIVNESLARRFWPGQSAIGRRITVATLASGPLTTVVGVVGDVAHESLRSSSEPEVYRPYQQFLGPALGTTMVLRTARDPERTAPEVVARIRELAPEQPIGRVRSMQTVVSNSINEPRFYAGLLTLFAGLALALALGGVYCLAAYSSQNRVHEFGVRIALGATRSRIRKLVLLEGLAVAVVGVAIGLLGAVGSLRVWESQLFGINTYDPVALATTTLGLLAAAVVAHCLPLLRVDEEEIVRLLGTS